MSIVTPLMGGMAPWNGENTTHFELNNCTRVSVCMRAYGFEYVCVYVCMCDGGVYPYYARVPC